MYDKDKGITRLKRIIILSCLGILLLKRLTQHFSLVDIDFVLLLELTIPVMSCSLYNKNKTSLPFSIMEIGEGKH